MILSDREWLRFVTFAFVAGGVIGVSATVATLGRGVPLEIAMGANIVGIGVAALAIHVTMRILLDRASEPAADQPDPEETHA